MNYKCKQCGEQFAVDENTKACPFCGLPISVENDAGGDVKRAVERKVQTAADLRALVAAYGESGDSKDVKTLVSAWDEYTDLPDFNRVWRNFIINAAGAAVARKDKELQPVLKNHAIDFDSRREDSDLFLSLLKTYPKLGTINDWEDLIQRTHGDQTQFAVICDSIVYCIIKGKSKSFAVEIFNLFFSKKEEWVEAGRKYIRALLSSDEIAVDVFPASAFNGATRKFAVNLKTYCKKYLDGDHSIALEHTKVWENYIAAEKARKKRKVIIASVTLAVLIAIAIGVVVFLNATNTDTISFTVDKVIEVTYGDEPAEFLKDYYVSYEKNSGELVTESLVDKMNGYQAENIGEQTVQFEFKGVTVTVTLIIKKFQLETPVLSQVGNYAKWEPVPHAQYYAVYVNATAVETEQTTSLSYDLTTNAKYGELKITVRAFTDDTKYDASPTSDPLTVIKLEAPRDLVYGGGKLMWTAVAGATTYELTVNGTPFTVSVPECPVDFVQGDNTVTINAKSNDENVIFGVTTQTIFYGRLDPITGMSYENGNVYWTAGEAVKSFSVYVNGTYWKDFSRNYFSVKNDGFVDSFAEGVHEISIVCKTAAMGIEPSEMKGYRVAIGNHITMSDGKLSWAGIGQGATYFVSVNGATYTFGENYIAQSECNWKNGNNIVTVNARLGGVEHICETVTIVKHSAPSISVSDSGWATDNNANNRYSVDGGAWSATLPDVSSLGAGDHTVRAKCTVAAGALFELESDEVEIKIKRASTPAIYVGGGTIQSSYDVESYTMKIFYASVGSNNWIAISSAEEIVNAGDYKLRAILVPKASAFPSYSGFLSSEYSAVVTAKKPAWPTVTYNRDTHMLTSNPVGAQFYYTDENGVEHEIVGGNTSNLPGGAFSVYARLNSAEDGVLNSANTPEYKRVSVFNLNIDFQANALQNQNVCNVTFGGCADISELTFTYKIEYFGADGSLVGGMDRTKEPPITISTKTPDGTTIWTQLTYYHPQYSTGSYNDIKSFKITVNIIFGTDVLIREATTYK